MALKQYGTALAKRWRLVLLSFFAIGLGSLFGSRLITPLYQATALVQVGIHTSNTSGMDINSLLASDQLVQTEATLATSQAVLQEVATHYARVTVDQLTREVTATAKLNTQLIEIDVLDAIPLKAAAIANDVAITLIRQQTQIFQQEAGIASNFLTIVQIAQPPSSPVQPDLLLNTIAGFCLALVFSLLLVIVLELCDRNVRTPAEVNKLLNLPVLTTIWKSNSQETINLAEKNVNTEPYRILRTNIGLSILDKPLHSLLITSASSFAGKSVIAANLAIFMARAGKNTLLVDADLRHPVQHKFFGLQSHKQGLSDAVTSFNQLTTENSFLHQQFISPLPSARRYVTIPFANFRFDSYIHSVGIPNLRIMPAGTLPPNPPELLDSKAMKGLMQLIASCGAEVVIIDAPPLLGLSDTSILTAMVDATLFVVDITHANKKELQQAKALLTQSGTPVLGCVVNKQPHRQKGEIHVTYFQEEQANREYHQNRERTPTTGHLDPKVSALTLSHFQKKSTADLLQS